MVTKRQKRVKEKDKQNIQLNLELGNLEEKPKFTPTPTIISKRLSAKPTVVFDTYWLFAAERQKIFFKKLENTPMPWTEDSILSTYKFTNAYRASDRTSQYLISHVIYRSDLPNSKEEVFFRIIIFKIFNKIETWQLLEEKLGRVIHAEYSFERYDKVLTEAMKLGKRIYSAAYIMPSGGKTLGHTTKHRNHLSRPLGLESFNTDK